MHRGVTLNRSRLASLPYPTNFVPHPIRDSRFTASQAAIPLFAAMLRRGDHEDGTIAIFLSAPLTSPRFLTRCQPMITPGCPRCRQQPLHVP